MRKLKHVTLFIFLFTSIIISQDSNNVSYSLFLEKKVSFGSFDTKIAEGEFKEGQFFEIPEATLPSSPIDFSVYQNVYNALVGGKFGIDNGALNNDIILKIYIRNLDSKHGFYKTLGPLQDTLFSYFEIKVWELPDSTYYHEDTNFYFNDGYFAKFSLPKSESLNNFLDIIGISTDDSLAFAYLENDSEGSKNWNANGITTIESEDSLIFKAIHLSRIGGGRKRIASRTSNNDSTTGVKLNQLPGLPESFILNQNYPNPFNPSTKISYSIKENGNVKLFIYNMLGKKIETLVSEYQQAGNYEAEFSNIEKNHLASGIYFYSLQTDFGIITKKMIMLK